MNLIITEINFMIRYGILLIYFFCSTFLLLAQTTFPVNGVNHLDQTSYLFKNATIHVDPLTTIDNGMMLIPKQKQQGIMWQMNNNSNKYMKATPPQKQQPLKFA